MKMVVAVSAVTVSLLTLAFLLGFTGPLFSAERHLWNPLKSLDSSSSLPDFALEKVLNDARPIFGKSKNLQTQTSTWMSRYPDDTKIVHMNIPGTHDSATWNYSIETQQSLKHVTNLINETTYPTTFFRCQDRSIVDMLNSGIRAFDLRYAQDVTNTTLVFWHGPALQSETATVDDVLFGFYRWLDDHPLEAIFLSFQYEARPMMQNVDNSDVQMQLYNILTSPAAKEYVVQTKNTLGTLGEARGKITLLRRFDLDLLPPSYESDIPGIHFSPSKWTPNGHNISLTYNENSGETAYIQDYFEPRTPKGSTARQNIQWKFRAIEAHLHRAVTSSPDSLFWSFASSTNTGNVPPDTPYIQALGNGTLTPEGGVNQKLVPLLKGMKRQRLGIVMFDFFEEPEGLVPLFLSLLEP